jgi:hypothetical protein
MASTDRERPPELSETEREALHEVELGVENLHRAHGHLVSFHHNTGRAMDHLAVAERLLRECGREDLADRLRDEHLPRGVVPPCDSDEATAGRWSYEILENFQDSFLEDLVGFGDRVNEEVGGGWRHVAERRQEREWKRRARDD